MLTCGGGITFDCFNFFNEVSKMADEEFMDAADDWELEAERQEEEERERLAEEERLRKEKEDKEKKRRLAAENTTASAASAVAVSVPLLNDEAKQILEMAQRALQDQQAAAALFGNTVDSFAEREIHNPEDAKKLGADIAQRFAAFDGEHLGGASAPVFDHILKVYGDSLELRELETLLNIAKQAVKSAAKASEKKPDKAIASQKVSLDLDTTDRGGAENADEFF